jgi:hypothetical protein
VLRFTELIGNNIGDGAVVGALTNGKDGEERRNAAVIRFWRYDISTGPKKARIF